LRPVIAPEQAKGASLLLQSDLANQSMCLDRIDSQIGRMETRLNFGGQAS
jgi:hypothetical protein